LLRGKNPVEPALLSDWSAIPSPWHKLRHSPDIRSATKPETDTDRSASPYLFAVETFQSVQELGY